MAKIAASPHASGARLRALSARGARAAPATARHVAACRRCRGELALIAATREALASAGPAGACPADELLVSFAEGWELAPEDAQRLDDHLSWCSGCTALVEAMGRAKRQLGLPPLASVGAATSLLKRLRSLVSFDMPSFVSIAARGQSAAAPGGFAEAMAAYKKRRWLDARRRLETVTAATPRSAAAAFYLGACLLREGRSADAALALERAVHGDARSGQYRWYLAQALLLDGRGDEALVQLDKAARLPGAHRDRAEELRRAVRAAVA